MIDIKRFRSDKKISQKEICDVLSIAQPYLSAMENGSRPLNEEKFRLLYKHFGNDILKYKNAEIVVNLNKNAGAEGTPVISTGRVIPYYDAEVAAGTSYGMDMVQTHQVGMIEIGGLLKDSEFALRVYGNSMTPNYPAGCVVGLKQHTDSFIEPGTVYVVETTDNRYLKRLYYTKGKDAFRCISDNTMKHENGPMTGEYFYQEFEIPLKDISRLLRVTGVIKRNIL